MKTVNCTVLGLALLLFASSTHQSHAQSVYTPYAFTTLAGGTYGTNNGTGSAAQFNFPYGVAVDTHGNVYVADTSNCTIRKVTPAGTVTTLAGLAGNFGSADGRGSTARLGYPFGVAVDTNGNVYVADSNNSTIRKVTPAGVVTTLAGLAGSFGSTDGTGSAAQFNYPDALALDKAGNIFVADTFNHTIRKVTLAGVVTTLAGSAGNYGTNDGTRSAAQFNSPYGVAVDTNGNIYVSDTGNYTIRKVTPEGVVITLAGSAGIFGDTDGIGSAARFSHPEGLAVDPAGNVYVAEFYNHTIRKVTPAGVVTTLAGLTGVSGNTDGTGNTARFYSPDGLALDSAGNVYVADSANFAIRKGSSIPFLQFIANPNIGRAPLVVQFTCPDTDSDGTALTNWNWTFGDGSSSTMQNPSHTYLTVGNFQPVLQVTNNDGIGVFASGPVVSAPTTSSDLVTNGGFESGSFSGWILAGQAGLYNLVDTFNQSSEGMQPHAPSSYFARLGQSGSLGYLSQTLATKPGAQYLLSFWLNSPDGLTPNKFLVSWNGSVLYTKNNLPKTGWTNLQFVVSATGSATILQFGFQDEPTALGLDDISVIPTQPGLSSVSLSGPDLVATCFNGLAGRTYHLLASADLALPFSQWSPVTANVLGANGSFILTATNAVDPNARQRFYILKME
jgi:PKD repeat protein